MNISLIALNCRYSHSCLSLFYVRNELQKKLINCQVTVTQLTINDPYYETLLRLSGSSGDYLMFSVYIWNSEYVNRLVNDLFLAAPHLKIILGGPQAPAISKLPDNCTVVYGEIEGVGQVFYHDLTSGVLKSVYKAEPGNPFSLPYQEHDYGSALKNRNIYYESSRGCPFSCAYCLSSVSRGISNIDLLQVKEELQQILAHEPKLIKFVDRTFNADPQRTLSIWQFLADHEGPTMFHFEIAPDLFTLEMLRFLEKVPAGKFQFEIGIQSTNPATLEAVNRKMDLKKASENISRLVVMNNIHLHLDLILGLPYETKETFQKSINYVFGLFPHYVQMGLLKMLPDTNISKNASQYGLICCQKPPYQVTATAWLDHKSLSELYWLGECIEAFYNNRYFRRLFRYLLSIEHDCFTFFEKLQKLCMQKGVFQLAKTQKLLNSVLVEAVNSHQEEEICKELLIFDWLSCGHRYLPDNLFQGNLNSYRDYLWHNMPENCPDLYSHNNRNDFFKKGVFFKFSEEVIRVAQVGPVGDTGNYVYFSPKQEEGVFKHSKAIVLTL